ncbi:hypothetical protein F442_13687, partial [Phytophthora nicotianae P10297]
MQNGESSRFSPRHARSGGVAARAFDLPRPPSEWSLYNILRNEAKLVKLPKDTYNYKKSVDPVIDSLDRALIHEFDKMEMAMKTLTDHALLYRSKLFVEEHYKSLPADKRPGFSKGWLHRFKKRHGIRCQRKQGEAASVDTATVADGRANMRCMTDFKVSGYKADKTRLTMAVATNADGSDKLPLLFIGRSKNPRAFKGHDVRGELGVEYTN